MCLTHRRSWRWGKDQGPESLAAPCPPSLGVDPDSESPGCRGWGGTVTRSPTPRPSSRTCIRSPSSPRFCPEVTGGRPAGRLEGGHQNQARPHGAPSPGWDSLVSLRTPNGRTPASSSIQDSGQGGCQPWTPFPDALSDQAHLCAPGGAEPGPPERPPAPRTPGRSLGRPHRSVPAVGSLTGHSLSPEGRVPSPLLVGQGSCGGGEAGARVLRGRRTGREGVSCLRPGAGAGAGASRAVLCPSTVTLGPIYSKRFPGGGRPCRFPPEMRGGGALGHSGAGMGLAGAQGKVGTSGWGAGLSVA